jgi:hypothetical protein
MNDLDWEAQTSLPVAEVRRLLRAVGLDAPEDGFDYFDWWERESRRWSPEQRDAVWEVMDKARFYTVVETEVELDG